MYFLVPATTATSSTMSVCHFSTSLDCSELARTAKDLLMRVRCVSVPLSIQSDASVCFVRVIQVKSTQL